MKVEQPDRTLVSAMALKDDERALHDALMKIAAAGQADKPARPQSDRPVLDATLASLSAAFRDDVRQLETASVSDSTISRAQRRLHPDETYSEKLYQAPVFRNTSSDESVQQMEPNEPAPAPSKMAELFLG